MENDISIITKMDLFPFINAFFTDPETFNKISNRVKEQHGFMLIRRLAINYPIELQYINTLRPNVHIINSLHKSLCTGKEPRWLFTKSKNPEKSFLDSLSIEVKTIFCDGEGIEFKDIEHFFELFSEYSIEKINTLKGILEQKTKM